MKKKSIMMLCMVLAMFTVLTGCGTDDKPSGDGSSGNSAGSDEFLVGFANNSDTYDYCAKFRSYLKEETEALGITIMVTDAAGDTNVQNGHVDDFIVQDAKVVSAISNDLDGSVPALEAARSADIPYVSFLTTVTGAEDFDKYIYIGSRNYDAGTVQGEYLVENLPENAEVLYFTGPLNDQQTIDRKDGLMDVLEERTDVTILAEYNVENQKDLGMSTAEDCLQAFDKFDAIICQNDDAALGAVEALKSAGKLDGITIIGIDGGDAALESVKAGELTMTVLQNAREQAKAGAKVFAQIRDGVNPAEIEDIHVPFTRVTTENVDEFIE